MNPSPSPSNFDIRDTSVDDIPELTEFLRPFFEQQLILPRTTEELQTLVRHGFVAVQDGTIVGFAALEVYSAKLGEIQSLAVCPTMQGRGIGRELVSCCVKRATALGVFELLAITASEKLFRDLGFDYSLPNQKRAFFYQTRPEK